jgi:uncharacterized protein YcfJ
MKNLETIGMTFSVALLALAVGCAPLSRPVTQREQTAAVGGLAGGAGGAIIGSMAGGAVAGGLFGIPIGAVAGWYVGDQLARESRMRDAELGERDTEIDRLRRENERFRREEQDRSARNTGVQPPAAQTSPAMIGSMPEASLSEQDVTRSQEATPSGEQIRQAQRKLNEMGYHSGHVDGVWGAESRAAITNFQASEGLAATGQLNKETMEALGIESRENERKH